MGPLTERRLGHASRGCKPWRRAQLSSADGGGLRLVSLSVSVRSMFGSTSRHLQRIGCALLWERTENMELAQGAFASPDGHGPVERPRVRGFREPAVLTRFGTFPMGRRPPEGRPKSRNFRRYTGFLGLYTPQLIPVAQK